MGGRGYGGAGRWRVYTYRYTVTTKMTCIKMVSDESHFNVSLIVRDKVTRQCPQTTTFLKRKESRSGIEPRSFRLPAYRLTVRLNPLSSVSVCSGYLFLLLFDHRKPHQTIKVQENSKFEMRTLEYAILYAG